MDEIPIIFNYILYAFLSIIIVVYFMTNCDTKYNNKPIWPCPYNNRLTNIFISKPDDEYTSMSLFDIYSFTHISHGMLFFIILYYIFNQKSPSMVFVALGLEILWEIIENSEYIINKYRAKNELSRNYSGDSIINSIGDILSCFIGFVIAWCFPKYTIPILLINEITLYLLIKDNLLTNMIQIFT